MNEYMIQAFKDWLLEESKKADKKAFHTGEQFNLGYAAGLDACCAKFIEYIKPKRKNCVVLYDSCVS